MKKFILFMFMFMFLVSSMTIVSADEVFVAVGGSGAVRWSEDGKTWTTTGTAGSAFLYGVSWSPKLELFVAVGDIGAVRWSEDGKTWATGTAGSASLRGVSYSPELELFAAVGNSGAVRWSEDGKTWTTSGTAGSTILNAITWSPELELFVAVGRSGAVRWSEDGKTWTTSGTAGSVDLNAITWSPELELFAAVGASGAVRWSEDGKTWTTSGTAGSTTLTGVAYSPELELFAAVGASGDVRWSGDGKTWTTSGTAGSTTLYGVAWQTKSSGKFTIRAQDAISGNFLTNLTAIVNNQEYTTTDGLIITDLLLNESIITDISVWSDEGPGYFNLTIENYNTSENLNAELYKKNSVLIQTYYENGTIIDDETFTVRFTSDIPSTFTTSTNATGGLFYNNLSIANWKIDVFNNNHTIRSFFVDVRDYSFTKLDVYFPTLDDRSLKTFQIKNSLNVAIPDAILTLTKFIDDAFVSLGQAKTDSTGTATFTLNEDTTYQLIIEAKGFATKNFGITTNPTNPLYTITLLSPGDINFTTVLGEFSYRIEPEQGTVNPEPTLFNMTVSSPGSLIEWFSATEGSNLNNVTGSPAGGTVILDLNLTNRSNERLTIKYEVKIQGYDTFIINRDYFIYGDINASTSLKSIKEDYQSAFSGGGSVLISSFIIALLVFFFSFIFPIDQTKGTKSLNSIIIILGVAIFGWFAVIPVTIGILVSMLSLLCLVGGGI